MQKHKEESKMEHSNISKNGIEEKLDDLEKTEQETIRDRQIDTFGYDAKSGRVKRVLARLFHGVDTEAYSSYNPIFFSIYNTKVALQEEYKKTHNGESYVPVSKR